jgi:hypothetical protein
MSSNSEANNVNIRKIARQIAVALGANNDFDI